MKWNLRLTAANRGIWKASELQRLLAERGLVVSAGKMSGLWSGDPASIKLDDLDVICAVLGCGVAELLIPEPDNVQPAAADEPHAGRLRCRQPPDDGDAQTQGRTHTATRLMGQSPRDKPAASCAGCLAWGVSPAGSAAPASRSTATMKPPPASRVTGSWR